MRPYLIGAVVGIAGAWLLSRYLTTKLKSEVAEQTKA